MNAAAVKKKAVRKKVARKKAAKKKKPAGKKRPKASVEKAAAVLPEKKPRPRPVKDGRQHIKKELLKGLVEITQNMIDSAKGGGTGQLKLLWELGGLHEDPTAEQKEREPSLARMLMDALDKQDAEKKNSELKAGEKK